ncbi:hypothetical protein [Umezakia ovalisporum]|jgi:hypothetical protein|uniref:Uncharacterized protein n=2 Tax=Umezakia ovalisporum TaxID=75695 RepID=A0AA43GXK0_9CYAN|nr:hypothetical protein [Umezakia ovalisporum]MBI1242660.1 hypothetical protein [Nostoc sp. RI_552]MDH6057574.1 hypothetical protein [Umezakia ovalisporum FSS-43]MDH6063457.1 hypothetical protein [Umezakia ovalisporum FSS-62]MDH6066485.1 hypothetical protein [Umezakia ovalisporum APH033B]MDH6072382.1 hypothetical protein [Umezakia ovalisporum CobakiLakeA]
MLTHHRKPVCLSLISTDLPFWSVVETAGTLYQKDTERFHLLLTEPPLVKPKVANSLNLENICAENQSNTKAPRSPRILWLEISPYRIIMTMQGNEQVSYRHFWEQGVYGVSRYWLPTESVQPYNPIRLRNFTKTLSLNGHHWPEHLRLEYELWAENVQLGMYILNLEIKH